MKRPYFKRTIALALGGSLGLGYFTEPEFGLMFACTAAIALLIVEVVDRNP